MQTADSVLRSQVEANLLEHLLDGCQVIDKDYRYLYVTSAVAKHARADAEQLRGVAMMDAFPGVERTQLFATLRQCMQERTPQRLESELKNPDGSIAWLVLKFEPVPDGVAIIPSDISEHRRTDELLRAARRETDDKMCQTEAMLRGITDAIADPIYLKDRAGRWIFANPATLAVVGKSMNEVIGRTDLEVYPELAIGNSLRANDCRIMDSGVTEVIEETIVGPNGTSTYLSTKSPFRDSSGNVIGLVGVSKDITELKRIEADALARARNEALEIAIDMLPIGVAMIERAVDGVPRVTAVNAAFCRIVGTEIVAGTSFEELPFKLYHPDRTSLLTQAETPGLRSALAGMVTTITEAHLQLADGSWRVITGTAVPVPELGNAQRAIAVVVDVTQERQALLALRASEERFRALIADAAYAFFLHDASGKFHDVNRRACESLGYSREELLTMGVADIECDFDLAAARHAWAQLDPGHHRTLNGTHRRKDGTTLPVAVSFACIESADERLYMCLVRDMTDELEAREAIEAAHATLAAALASMTDAVFISDRDGRFIDFNDAFATFHKFKSKGECAVTFAEYPDILEVFMADGSVAPIEQWAVPRALRGETKTNAIYGLRRKDTGESWVGSYSFAPIRDKQGNIVGSVVAGRDITEHKRIEEELRESQSLLKAVFESPGAIRAVFELDGNDARVIMDNGQVARSGRAGEQRLFRDELKSLTAESVHAILSAAKESLTTRAAIELGIRAKAAMGGGWFRSTVSPLGDAPTDRQRFVIEAVDVTEQQLAQEALRANGERLRQVLSLANVAVWAANSDATELLDVTDSFERIYGRSKDEFRANPRLWLDVVHPEDRWIAEQSTWELIQSGHSIQEYRIVRGDGQIRWIADEKSLIRDRLGAVTQIGGAAHDVTERRKAEADLRRLNAELETRVGLRTQELAAQSEFSRLLLKTIPFGMSIVDENCNILFLNDRLKQQIGGDAIGRPCYLFLRDDHSQYVQCPMKQAQDQSGTNAFQATGLLGGRTFNITHTPMTFEGKKAVLELFEDITERRRAEELKLCRARLLEDSAGLSAQGLLRRAIDEICKITDSPTGFYLDVAASEKVVMRAQFPSTLEESYALDNCGISYGIDEVGFWADCAWLQQPIVYNDCSSLPPSQVCPDTEAVRVRELVVPVVRAERVVALVVVRNRAAPYGEVDLSAVSFLAEVAYELSARRQHEEIIAEQRQLFDLVFEEALAGFWDWTLPSGAMYMSKRFKAVLGYAEDEIPNTLQAWQNLVHPDDLHLVFAHGQSLAETQGDSISALELRYFHKNGDTVWTSLIGTVVKWSANARPLRIVGCQIDITQNKRMEQAIRASEEAAAAANNAKSAFLANMSHEIRTPMNAVLGFTQLLLRSPALLPTQRRYLDTINRAGDHLLFLIDQVLQIARIESGRATLEEATLDLRALLDDVRQLFETRASAKSLTLTAVSTKDLPRYVIGDEVKLRQILFNLLGNAIKFTDSGNVTVRATGAKEHDQRWLVIEVEDSGHGISAEEVAHLFRKFEQTEAGRRAKQGTGLGLAISQEFARLMGGMITVRSVPGMGSTFCLKVPLKEGAESDLRPKAPVRVVKSLSHGHDAIRVLVVDDVEDNRSFAVGLLESVGFETAQAADGEQAIREFSRWQPHLILMDMRMPGLDGAEAIQRIRGMPMGRAVNVIAVTASAYAGDRDAAHRLGADDFLSKPYREHALFDKIKGLLGVSYDYADESMPPASAHLVRPELASSAERIAAIPATLRQRICHAALIADLDAVLALLEPLAAFDADIAAQVRNHAERFEYQRIRDALQSRSQDI